MMGGVPVLSAREKCQTMELYHRKRRKFLFCENNPAYLQTCLWNSFQFTAITSHLRLQVILWMFKYLFSTYVKWENTEKVTSSVMNKVSESQWGDNGCEVCNHGGAMDMVIGWERAKDHRMEVRQQDRDSKGQMILEEMTVRLHCVFSASV